MTTFFGKPLTYCKSLSKEEQILLLIPLFENLRFTTAGYLDPVVLHAILYYRENWFREIKINNLPLTKANGLLFLKEFTNPKIDITYTFRNSYTKKLGKLKNDIPELTKSTSFDCSDDHMLDFIKRCHDGFSNLFGEKKLEQFKEEIERDFHNSIQKKRFSNSWIHRILFVYNNSGFNKECKLHYFALCGYVENYLNHINGVEENEMGALMELAYRIQRILDIRHFANAFYGGKYLLEDINERINPIKIPKFSIEITEFLDFELDLTLPPSPPTESETMELVNHYIAEQQRVELTSSQPLTATIITEATPLNEEDKFFLEVPEVNKFLDQLVTDTLVEEPFVWGGYTWVNGQPIPNSSQFLIPSNHETTVDPNNNNNNNSPIYCAENFEEDCCCFVCKLKRKEIYPSTIFKNEEVNGADIWQSP
jgi:hypothetical protein